ncbi:MAG: hypothetical protein ACLRZ9_02625 [Eubacterium sp.]
MLYVRFENKCINTDKKAEKSSVRKRLDTALDRLSDKELSVIETTVNGLCKAKEQTEE